jgi:hypothetical protein
MIGRSITGHGEQARSIVVSRANRDLDLWKEERNKPPTRNGSSLVVSPPFTLPLTLETIEAGYFLPLIDIWTKQSSLGPIPIHIRVGHFFEGK